MPKPASKTIIAVDIDDVIAGTTDALRLFVNQRHGINLTERHYRAEGEYWSYYETVWRQHGIDEPGLKDIFHNGMHVDQSSIQPIAGSRNSLKRLRKKYDLMPVTSRPEEMKKETTRWVDLYFDNTFNISPVFLGFGPGTRRSKGQVCLDMGALYLIDDNVEHCESALESGIQSILFGNYGWHQRIPNKVVRCKNWRSVLGYFENEKSR